MKHSSRIAYIDVAKGILILCLLYGHMLIEIKWHGFTSSAIDDMMRLIPLYNAFFMQTFFLITGLCSTFTSDFPRYLWKNVKTLILPAICITWIGYLGTDINNGVPFTLSRLLSVTRWLYTESGPWFILSLFTAKIMYWPISRINIKSQLLVIAILYFLGLLLQTLDIVPNIMWHRHTLLMMPFLCAGNILKDYMPFFDRYLKPLALAAVILIPLQVVLYFNCHYALPMHDRGIQVGVATFPVHFLNVMLGTAFIFHISRKWQNNAVLRTFGFGSLLVYLINEPEQRFVLKCMMPLCSSPRISYILSTLFSIGAYLFCVLIFYVVVKVVYGNKYLSTLVGKW